MRRWYLVVAALVWLWLAAACTERQQRCGADGCEDHAEAKARSAVDWGADSPSYSALFRVVDEYSEPLSGASVIAGDLLATTDDAGEVRLPGISVLERRAVQVRRGGFAPTAVLPSHASAGLQQLQVRLLRLGEVEVVDTDKTVHFEDGDVQWRLPRRPFAAADGSIVEGAVKVQVVSLSAPALPRDAVPADSMVRLESGARALLRDHLSVIYTRVTDMEGDEVALAPGRTALLRVRLPGALGMEEGEPLGLYSLDPLQARWLRESSCTVARDAASGELGCSGPVTHFSYWLVAREWTDEPADRLGCVNFVVDTRAVAGLLQGSGRFVGYMPLLHCSAGERCVRDPVFAHGLTYHLPPGAGAAYPALCGLAQAGEPYRFVAGLFAAEASSQLFVADFSLDAPGGDLPASQLVARLAESSAACSSLCQQVIVKPEPGDLADLRDEDGDGYYTTSAAGSAAHLPPADCNDGDPTVYPGAPERPCDPIDRNCDGQAFSPGQRVLLPADPTNEDGCATEIAEVTASRALCPQVWNRFCGESCFERSAEQPGNAYDEDCDGRVQDRDNDGYDVHMELSERPDCDDFDPQAHPDAAEQPGNDSDEDCDGVVLDADGDGYYAYGHEAAAVAVLDNATEDALRFGDCDDWDARTHPGLQPRDEAGPLAHLFVAGTDGERVRRAAFCEYFGAADGAPTPLFRLRVRDRNCDGWVTDVDGDGLTPPGDVSLGVDKAMDCDDYDPRIGLVVDSHGAPACGTADRSGLHNETTCRPAVDDGGIVGAPEPCPLLSGRIPTRCSVVTEEVGLCAFPGWNTADPPRWTPGTLWGPCDGLRRRLPDCGAGTTCGVPVPYGDGLLSYLKEHYTTGEDLEYQGMCFQECVP